MKVSVIIPVFNRWDFTEKCLESVFDIGSKYPFEVIVVDNASSDGTREHLEAMAGKITYLRNEENLGFAKACNRGAKEAKGEYLLFLNNDTVALPDWLDVLVEELDGNREASIVGSKLLYPDGSIQHAGVVFGKDKCPYHIYRRESSDKPYVNRRRAFQCVTGACLLIRKVDFDRVSGFDTRYINGYEDLDLCLKIRRNGGTVIYHPLSVLYHFESISEGRLSHSDKNRELFLGTWNSFIDVDDILKKTEDGTANMSTELEESRILIEGLKGENSNLIDEVRYLREKVYRMENSIFWKMRNLYMRLKGIKRNLLNREYLPYISSLLMRGLFSVREGFLGPKTVSVVICVHNALDDVKVCVRSVMRSYSHYPFSLVIVDDGSDSATQEFLQDFAGKYSPKVKLLRNDEALGYTKAANIGMKASSGDYVVLLNSDTLVERNWIKEMLTCLLSNQKLGVVGPLSNAASWQSVPDLETDNDWAKNRPPKGMSVSEWSKKVANVTSGRRAYIPFLNGFCLMIRRRVLNEVGWFDEDAFGRGYGEENDYCMRVSDAGWKLAVCGGVYVYHAKSRSYSDAKRKDLVKYSDLELAKKYGKNRIEKNVLICRENADLKIMRDKVAALFYKSSF